MTVGQFTHKDILRVSVSGLAKIQKDYVYCLPFINLTGDLITKDQIPKAGFSVDELMLTMSNNSFIL